MSNETTITIQITIDLDSNKADVRTDFQGYPAVHSTEWKAHETFLSHLLYTVSLHVMQSIEEHVIQQKKDMN